MNNDTEKSTSLYYIRSKKKILKGHYTHKITSILIKKFHWYSVRIYSDWKNSDHEDKSKQNEC